MEEVNNNTEEEIKKNHIELSPLKEEIKPIEEEIQIRKSNLSYTKSKRPMELLETENNEDKHSFVSLTIQKPKLSNMLTKKEMQNMPEENPDSNKENPDSNEVNQNSKEKICC